MTSNALSERIDSVQVDVASRNRIVITDLDHVCVEVHSSSTLQLRVLEAE